MTREEAIEAIRNAEEIFVYVRTAVSYDGTAHQTEEFPVTRELAITVMQKIRDTEYEPNLVVSREGAKVVVGQHADATPLQSLGHNDSNNGNF
ncbi:MAG: hypothetical protein V4603_14445 [Pseudomonadota bacterium]